MRVLVAAVVGLALSSGPAIAGIVAPVDRAARQAVVRPTNPRFTCQVPPPAMHLLIPAPYVDDASTVITPASRATYLATVAPVTALRAAVTAAGDAWLASDDAHPAAADCLVTILDTWAGAGGFMGVLSVQATYEVKWSLVPLASAWAQVRARSEPAVRDRVDHWLRALVLEMQASYPEPSSAGARNNHVAWAAAASMTLATATGDLGLFAWGVERAGWALAEVAPDGTLPLELQRGAYALHYHVFTVTPLVLAAAIASANGIDLWSDAGGALDRLAGRTFWGLLQPEQFTALTGAAQRFGIDELPAPPPEAFAWVELWQTHVRQRGVEDVLAPRRPLRNPLLGGNVTLAWAVPLVHDTVPTTTTSTTTSSASSHTTTTGTSTTTSVEPTTTTSSAATTTTLPAPAPAPACDAPAPIARARVRVDKLGAPAGVETLHVRGRVPLPPGTAAVPPGAARRLRLVVERDDGERPVDVAAPLDATRGGRCPTAASRRAAADDGGGPAVSYARLQGCPGSARGATFAVGVTGVPAGTTTAPFRIVVALQGDDGTACGTTTVRRCSGKRGRVRCR